MTPSDMGLQFCIMKFLFSVITFLFFSLVVSSVAQIGEPRSYFLSKFGQPNGSIEPRLVESVGKAEVFKHDKSGLEFIVEYDKEDTAWVIIFHGRSVRTATAESLVAKNLGPKVQQKRFLNTEYWIEREKDLRAFYYKSPSPKLVVMTAASLESERKPRLGLLKALPDVLPPKGGVRGSRPIGLTGTKNDPLADFGSTDEVIQDEESKSEEVEKEEE